MTRRDWRWTTYLDHSGSKGNLRDWQSLIKSYGVVTLVSHPLYPVLQTRIIPAAADASYNLGHPPANLSGLGPRRCALRLAGVPAIVSRNFRGVMALMLVTTVEGWILLRSESESHVNEVSIVSFVRHRIITAPEGRQLRPSPSAFRFLCYCRESLSHISDFPHRRESSILASIHPAATWPT